MIVAICLLTDKKSISLKATIKNVNFPTKFSLGNIPNKFDVVDSKEVSLKGNVYDFSVDYDAQLMLLTM